MGYGLVFVELLIAIYSMNKGRYTLFKFFYCITILQNFILVLFSNFFNETSTALFILVKECCVYLLALLYWLNQLKKRKDLVDVAFCFFFLLCLVNAFFYRSPLNAAVSSLRQFFIPYMCYYFGKMLYRKGDSYNLIDRFYVHSMIPVCIISLFFYIPDPSKLWQTLGYNQYTLNKTGLNADGNYIANFYTYDFGHRLKRMVSIMADPLAFSHLIIVAIFLFTILNKKERHNWWELLFLLCGVLCLSKYHVIVILMYVFWKLYANTRETGNKIIYNVGLIAILIVAFLWLVDYTGNLTENTAIGNHFSSLISGFKSISLFGSGVGTTGYNAILYGDLNVEKSTVTESFFATMLSQIGVIGTAVYYLGLLVICWNQYEDYRKTKDRHFFVNLVLISSMLMETLVSASSVSMLGSGIFFILAGYYSRLVIKNNYMVSAT